MKKFLLALAGAAGVLFSAPALAETVNCTAITAVPVTITAQGVYCLKKNIVTAITSGAAITIAASNVTIDFNEFKLGGLASGAATQAVGVYALNRKNITLRNGNIRGFNAGVYLDQNTADGSAGHVVEDNLIDRSTQVALSIAGSGIAIRRNRIVNTDSTPPAGALSAPSGYGASGIATARPGTVASLPNVGAPQAGTGAVVNGVYANDLIDSEITNNFISNSISPSQSYAIVLDAPSNVVVARNTILETLGASYAAYGAMMPSVLSSLRRTSSLPWSLRRRGESLRIPAPSSARTTSSPAQPPRPTGVRSSRAPSPHPEDLAIPIRCDRRVKALSQKRRQRRTSFTTKSRMHAPMKPVIR